MPSLCRAKLLGGQEETAHGVHDFVYRGVEDLNSDGGATRGPFPSNTEPLWSKPPAHDLPAQPENKYSEDDLKIREQKAWQEGFQEATSQARVDLEEALALERKTLAAAMDDFAKSREEYFRNVEGETVRLVLAIARKVLHREAQVDPLLLTGVVRVALEKIANGTSVRLRVPANQAEEWRATLEPLAELESTVEIVGDKSLKGPQCLIVTETGTTDFSLEEQLAEIERGFLDLLSQRPGEAPKELCSPSYAA